MVPTVSLGMDRGQNPRCGIRDWGPLQQHKFCNLRFQNPSGQRKWRQQLV